MGRCEVLRCWLGNYPTLSFFTLAAADISYSLRSALSGNVSLQVNLVPAYGFVYEQLSGAIKDLELPCIQNTKEDPARRLGVLKNKEVYCESCSFRTEVQCVDRGGHGKEWAWVWSIT